MPTRRCVSRITPAAEAHTHGCLPIQSEAERTKCYHELMALKHKCLRDGKPYIRELVAGNVNTSPEGRGKDFDVSSAQARDSVL